MAFHLVKRFLGSITSQPLSPSEQADVRQTLPPELADLFFTQRSEDQRHALVVRNRIGNEDGLAQTALLHDIGKIESDLGPIGRSLATLWSMTSLPIWGRWYLYVDHGGIGAAILESNGASEFAVAFTRHHPAEPPAGFDVEQWRRLAEADGA